jgi:hypothetical protein
LSGGWNNLWENILTTVCGWDPECLDSLTDLSAADGEALTGARGKWVLVRQIRKTLGMGTS